MAVKITPLVGYKMPRGWDKSSTMSKAFWRMMRKATWEAAALWHKKFLPKHFTEEAESRYPIYFRRSPKSRHPPLVRSGKLRRDTVESPVRRTQRSNKGEAAVRVKLATNRSFSASGSVIKSKDRHNLANFTQYRKELTATADAEVKSLARFIVRRMKVLITQDRITRRKRLV